MATIAMVAGEASGDLLGAHLLQALRPAHPELRAFGIGGPKMQAAGFEARWPAERLAVRGYVEVLRHLREILNIRRSLLSELRQVRPQVFVGIDAPDFNLPLAAKLRRTGIPTIHYVSPSVWAWRGHRIRHIARAIDHVLCLFPFEPALYQRVGVAATFVGHPLADIIPLESQRHAARERLGLGRDDRIVALLPGSRRSELDYMAELFIDAAELLARRQPITRFLVPMATRETRQRFEAALGRRRERALPLTLLFGHTQHALTKTPMVIAYRMAPVSWQLMRRMRYQPWVGLPNILSQQFVVPEFLQDEATPARLAEALLDILQSGPRRAAMRQRFEDIHRQLRRGSAERAAEVVAAYLDRGGPAPVVSGAQAMALP
jgi:lipid-A-disaccharide synthase